MDLQKLRAKRTNIKGQITQFVNFVKEHGEERKEQLPDRIKRAEDLYNAYNDIQSQIAEKKIESIMAKDPPATQEERQALEAEIVQIGRAHV